VTVIPKDDELMEVVPPMGPAAAKRAFQDWLHEHDLQRADVADDDIRVDVIRWFDGGTRWRYLVRRAVLSGPEYSRRPRAAARTAQDSRR
jgi:hypothetical protein